MLFKLKENGNERPPVYNNQAERKTLKQAFYPAQKKNSFVFKIKDELQQEQQNEVVYK